MASSGRSLARESDLSLGDEVPIGIHHPLKKHQNGATADSMSTRSLSQHSSNDHHHPIEAHPNGDFSTSVTNDSFSLPLGRNPELASTRPFDNHQSSTEVEQFLSSPPISNQTFSPASFVHPPDALHATTNSSFVSIPKAAAAPRDVPSSGAPPLMHSVRPVVVHPQPTTATQPLATAHYDPRSNIPFHSLAAAVPHGSRGDFITATQSSSLMPSSRPPTAYADKTASATTRPLSLKESSPGALVATASSSGRSGITGVGVPRSPSRRTPVGPFPSTPSVNVSTAGSATMGGAPSVGPRRPSPGFGFGRTNSNHSLTSHGSEAVSLAPIPDGGVTTLANYSPLLRSSVSPSYGGHPSAGPHGYTAVPSPASTDLPPTQREANLPHSVSEGELRHFFDDRGSPNITPLSSTTAPVPRGMESAGAAGRRSPSRSGGPALSVGSRVRGVVRASETSSGFSGPHSAGRYTPSGNGSGGSGCVIQPRWLSAVERVKSNRTREDYTLYDPVLPYDQSKLGMQTRQAGQQGMLTAGKLRAWEAQHAGAAKSSDRGGGLQPLVACSATGLRPNSLTSRPGSQSPTRMPPTLTAQEEVIASTARYNRPLSDQGSRRTGYIRSGTGAGTTSAYGGSRHAVSAVPNAVRGSIGSGVITASETTSAAGMNYSGGNSAFAARSEQGGIPSYRHGGPSSKFGPAEHKLANLFQLRFSPNGAALHAKEASVIEVTTSFDGSNKRESNNGVLHASEEQKAVTPGSPGDNAGAGGAGGGGGGGGGSNNGGNSSNNNNNSGPKKHSKRGDLGNPNPSESKEVKKQMATDGDEDERDERNFRMRNINALHAIPWDQRQQLPMTGFGTRFFALLSTPRFWEKLDWTFRGSILTVLPTMVLTLEPATTDQFPMVSSLSFYAFWITMPTFGSGMRELIIALKGFSFGLFFLIIVVATQPGPDWLLLVLLFVFTLFSSFVAEETKKTTAYVLASTIMQYLTDHKGTNFTYIGRYYEGLLIALAFGTAAFLVPFIRWSSDIARHYIKAMANSLSIDLQGTLSSFWVRSPLERELNVMRLRQLRATAEKCIGKIETALNDSDYEPHTSAYMMCMTNRFNFCKSIHNILGSLSHVIELIAENPSSVDTPMCNAFGEQIGDDLAIISSAMDSMVLKICDFERIVTQQEIQFFREARERFQEAVSRVREDVILTNENYETDESDILLGFFMFSVDEICEVISQFEETPHPPSTLVNALLFPVRDVKSVIGAFKNLGLTIVRRHTIPRRLKEAIKLAVCMVLPCIFQVYALGNDSVSPMAGASVVALIYNPTGAESFHYASGRLLGTVLGSMASLLSVQIADGRRWVLYLFIILLSFIGAYVQAAPGFYALGNAIVCSTISVCTQYKNQNAAMVRIQQNCFAILMYFAVVTILWPMRARTKVKMSLDFSLRCARESITRMLRNLDMPYDPSEVTADVSALLLEMDKKVRTQVKFIPGAVEEPTMGSVTYPEDAWKRIVDAERKLWLALSMMRFAYHTFMSSRADQMTELSVHWVVLHRISPHARDLSDLIYAAIDLYLLSLNNTTVVPTSHLTRLRLGMMDAHKAIEDTYIRTISRKVAGENSDDEENEDGNDSYRSSYAGEDDYYDPSEYGSYGNGPQDSTSHPPTTTNNRGVAGGQWNNNNNNSNGHNGDKKGGEGGDEGKDNNAASGSGAQKSTHDKTNNASGAKQKKKATHHREGSDSSDSSSDEGSSNKDGQANDAGHHKKKAKKKMGYLGYDLTKDEEAALRAFVANRVANNNTFWQNRSMTGNMTFNNNYSMGGTMQTAAIAAAAAVLNGSRRKSSMAGSPPQVNNDARLMAVRGGDDDLAAELRKKHNISVKRDKDEDNADKDDENNNTKTNAFKSKETRDADADVLTESLANLNLNNSFRNNNFLRNTSFLGVLFRRKSKGTHNLDAQEMRDNDASSSGSATTKHKKKMKNDEHKPRRSMSGMIRKGKREKDDDDSSSVHSTPSTSPTRSHGGMRSDRHTEESEFSDIEDEPRPNRKSGGRSKTAGAASSKEREGKDHGRPPMAHSMPTVLHSKEDGGDKSVHMARSTPNVSTSGGADTALTSLGKQGGNALPEDVMGGSTPQSAQPSPTLRAGSFGTVATVGVHSAEGGSTPFGFTPLDGKEGVRGGAPQQQEEQKGSPPVAQQAATKEPAASATRSSGGGSPEDELKAGKKTDSHNSSNHTGGTEKKFLTGGYVEGGTTHGSSEEKEPHYSSSTSDDLVKALGSPQKPKDISKNEKNEQDAGDVSGQPAAGSYGTNSMNLFSVEPAGHTENAKKSTHKAGPPTESLESMRDRDPGSSEHFDEGEILNTISFFDPEKGEFVLTNHDIHSLEAFLFGTQALVTYINALQNAILEMQHETELAKRL